jgi:hypothetical protein
MLPHDAFGGIRADADSPTRNYRPLALRTQRAGPRWGHKPYRITPNRDPADCPRKHGFAADPQPDRTRPNRPTSPFNPKVAGSIPARPLLATLRKLGRGFTVAGLKLGGVSRRSSSATQPVAGRSRIAVGRGWDRGCPQDRLPEPRRRGARRRRARTVAAFDNRPTAGGRVDTGIWSRPHLTGMPGAVSRSRFVRRGRA